MPELPEVETIRRDLEQKIIAKTIVGVEVYNKNTVHGDVDQFKKILIKNSIQACQRIGKLLIFVLEQNQFLLVHLKMTGKLLFQEKGTVIAGGHSLTPAQKETHNKYTRMVFEFVDGSKLLFEDLRKFGYMSIVNDTELQKVKKRFGIEPLTKEFTLQNFKQAFQGRKTSLKAVLLNQLCIAGIGNIYADEICFATKILPCRSATKLSASQIKALHQACNDIIEKAIHQRGTTFNSYVDGHGKKGKFVDFLQVYRRQGKACFRCTGQIQKTRVAGRGTHFCPQCQK